MKKLKIFIVDDERILRVSLADDLKDEGYKVFEFSDAAAAMAKLREEDVDVIISDIKMPGIGGIEFLHKVKTVKPEVFVILMTAYATVDNAVKAMKLGAYDYITKPFETEEILIILERIAELKEIKKENIRLQHEISSGYNFESFIGKSDEIIKMFELVKVVTNQNTTVLISGETGTGKELLANIIHFNSNRRKKPMIKVSCAILSREIFESELFGHEKGAFTGAEKQRNGRFELADEGTLYLDDIDDMPLDLQVKILRVLEEGEIERVGSSVPIKTDVRIIASTKADLKQLVKEGRFREDLYYRLNVFPVSLPPLREREGDIPLLLNHFANQFSENKQLTIEEDVYFLLNNYDFPGNIRELKNLMERMILLATNGRININHVPYEIRNPAQFDKIPVPGEKPLNEILSEIEINAIVQALQKFNHNISKAAEFLRLPISTLRTKMEKYAIK